jgi:hypothetical protein
MLAVLVFYAAIGVSKKQDRHSPTAFMLRCLLQVKNTTSAANLASFSLHPKGQKTYCCQQGLPKWGK